MEGQSGLVNSPPPSWIDAEFVQTALRNGEDDSTITVTKCDVTSNAVESKFAANAYNVVATLETGEKRSLIVKCRAEAGLGNKISGLFETEVKLLTETLPAMEALLQTACPEEFQPFAPKCYYHGSEPLPFVVLEDPSQEGFNYYLIDVSRCRMALRTLARFHAASIAFLQQNPEEIEYFNKHDFAEKFRGEVEDFVKGGIECLANEVKKWPAFEEYADKLLRLKETICNKLEETLRQKDGSLNCLIRPDSTVTGLPRQYGRRNDFSNFSYQLHRRRICTESCGERRR
ncbi:uncharacterized protein [Anabrus simplex]|uniref:uncharacterized protein isoform X4 n=1 Tax=Anabrus simplex TaxID=316456 RepID=UPI0035A2B72C